MEIQDDLANDMPARPETLKVSQEFVHLPSGSYTPGNANSSTEGAGNPADSRAGNAMSMLFVGGRAYAGRNGDLQESC